MSIPRRRPVAKPRSIPSLTCAAYAENSCMSDDDDRAATNKPQQPRRRWFQISLRTLLLFTALVAAVAALWHWYDEPFRRQRLAMAAIEQAGGSYQATSVGPTWLRRLVGERFQ